MLRLFTLSLLIVLTATACGDDFLDRTPINGFTPNNFYENELQITDAVNGVYPVLRGQFTGFRWQLGEFRSDNTTFDFNAGDRGGSALEELDYFQAFSGNGAFASLWSSSYTGIARVNFLLAALPEADFVNEDNRAIREAEARFLRAFFYYHLTLHLGDVPIVLEPLIEEAEAVALRRSPQEDVYDQAIIPDLEFAIANLPEEYQENVYEIGRATADAARMLLAKAHFVRRDYADALPLLTEVIESGRYTLLADFREVFAPGDEPNDEIIWNLQFDATADQGAGFMINWLPLNSTNEVSGDIFPGSRAGRNRPTCDLIRAYDPNDERFAATIGIYLDEETGDTITYYPRKFIYPPIPQAGLDLDWPVFRYADALLMRSEALLETQGGIPDQVFLDINQIRARAKLGLIFPGNPNPELDVQTTEALTEALRRERRLELAIESHRWYDLVRWGIAEETMIEHGLEQKAKQSFLNDFPDAYTDIPDLFAIPDGQVQQYGYRQNPGWD